MKTKKLIAMLLVAVTLMTVVSTTALAGSWVTGNFTGYRTVYLSNSNKVGKIRIHTYHCVRGNHTGQCWSGVETSGKLRVTVRTLNGSYISSTNIACPNTFTLPKGSSGYKLTLAIRQDLGSAANFTNLGNCCHWAIETKSNTHF